MKFQIDKDWLRRRGIDLPSEEDMEALAEQVTAEFQLRIGTVISDGLTGAQLDKFETFDNDDDRLAWLDEVYPNYKKLVAEEYGRLLDDLRQIKRPNH